MSETVLPVQAPSSDGLGVAFVATVGLGGPANFLFMNTGYELILFINQEASFNGTALFEFNGITVDGADIEDKSITIPKWFPVAYPMQTLAVGPFHPQYYSYPADHNNAGMCRFTTNLAAKHLYLAALRFNPIPGVRQT